MACWSALFSRVVLIQCWFIVSEIQFHIPWFQIVAIPPEAPLPSLMLPLYYLCCSMTLLIFLWFCFISCNIIIPGFSEMIRSLRATTLEGCPSPLLFHERILIISCERCKEFLSLPCLCLLCLCLLVPEYMIQWGSGAPMLCIFTHFHPCAIWQTFF